MLTKSLEEIVPEKGGLVSNEVSCKRNEVATYLRKSLVGCAVETFHQLFAKTLNTLKTNTKNVADHLALKPTATITHAISPIMETITRETVHFPCRMNPRKRKISKIRPARRKL